MKVSNLNILIYYLLDLSEWFAMGMAHSPYIHRKYYTRNNQVFSATKILQVTEENKRRLREKVIYLCFHF